MSRRTAWVMQMNRLLLRLLTPTLGVLAALFVTFIVLVATKVNVGAALHGLWEGSLGSSAGMGAAIVRSTAMALIAIGVSVGIRAGTLNVGAEGQLYVGAFAATAVALHMPGPASVNLLMATMAGFIAGAAWILVPAVLKTRRGIDEVITTVMMNYIGIQFVSYLIAGPFQAQGALFPETDVVPHVLPTLIPGTSSSYGFVLALALAIVVTIIINFSSAGLALRAVGANWLAARHAGIHDRRVQLTAMLCSGGLCGIGGAVEILGFQHRLQEGFSPGYGSQGLVAGILANGSPLSAVFFALLLGALQSGGEELQRQAGVPIAFVFIVQGLAIMLLVANWIRFVPRPPASEPQDPTPLRTAVATQARVASDDSTEDPP